MKIFVTGERASSAGNPLSLWKKGCVRQLNGIAPTPSGWQDCAAARTSLTIRNTMRIGTLLSTRLQSRDESP
jgi:hypothetical protein